MATFHSKYYDDFYQTTGSKTLAELGTKYVVNLFAKCDQVWAVSSSTAQVLRDYGYKGPIEIMENGTDLKEPDPAAAKEAEERFALGNLPVLLFVGQMNWKKNIRRILEAVSVLVKEGRELRLVMAGQGPSKLRLKNWLHPQIG